MALKQLILRQKIKVLNQQLAEMRAKDTDFETRSAALKTREEELATAISEVTDETNAEERELIESQVSEFESEQEALGADQAAHEVGEQHAGRHRPRLLRRFGDYRPCCYGS